MMVDADRHLSVHVHPTRNRKGTPVRFFNKRRLTAAVISLTTLGITLGVSSTLNTAFASPVVSASALSCPSTNSAPGSLGNQQGCAYATAQGITFSFAGYGQTQPPNPSSEFADITNSTTGQSQYKEFQWYTDSQSFPVSLEAGDYTGFYTLCPQSGGLCKDIRFSLTVGQPSNGGCPTGISHQATGEPWAVASMTANVNGQVCGGYWVVTRTGGVTAVGAAPWLGDVSTTALSQPMVGIAATPDHQGYWLVAADGGIFNFGDAQFYGSTGNVRLSKPVVAMAASPSGHGYWLAAADGGIFNFGDAQFYGSTGNVRLNQPMVGMAASQSGGYWLVAADGGIFNFNAPFFGSTGNVRLNQPVVGMSEQPDGQGYRLVARDGGVFNFGDAQFYGSLPGQGVQNPNVTTMATSVSGNGYYLINGAGTIWAFGDAPYLGNAN